uniref:Uncharacterized protein n=1 Tax=Oryza sativa subsp. japonica TaxID=39947 RepID=Q6EU36_ORYSJ|nr:hypothetical protein [Oryza sativa Japonica Group]
MEAREPTSSSSPSLLQLHEALEESEEKAEPRITSSEGGDGGVGEGVVEVLEDKRLTGGVAGMEEDGDPLVDEVSFFLVRQGLVSTHGGTWHPTQGYIVFDLRRRDKSNVPSAQAIVSFTSASFEAASVHSTSWIALGFCRYRLNRVARLD